MKNSPSGLSESKSLYSRLAILALVGMASAGCPSSTADAAGLIPLCNNLRGHRSPSKGPWLKGNEPAKAVCVVDGDTFDVMLKNHRNQIMRVRLWGVDCPESSFNDKCKRKGYDECSREIKRGKKVTQGVRMVLADGDLILQPPYKDNGNRKLAYVEKNGKDLGRALIETCMCEEGYSHARKNNYRRAADRCGR